MKALQKQLEALQKEKELTKEFEGKVGLSFTQAPVHEETEHYPQKDH
jgi:hypothetical protein